jgi:hypothetical protein
MGKLSKKVTRAVFRSGVLERDGHRCAKCGAAGELDAHHITDRNELPAGGYVLENGIALCQARCHPLAEVYHASGKTRSEPGYSPEELYALIGSSYERALAASRALAAAGG